MRCHSGESPGVALDDIPCHFGCFVGGVVEDLDFKTVAWIVELTDCVNETVDDELLVEDRELDGDERELAFGEAHGRLVPLCRVFFVFEIEPDQLVAVYSVERQDDHDDEVGDQNRRIEGVPVVEALECLVEIV